MNDDEMKSIIMVGIGLGLIREMLKRYIKISIKVLPLSLHHEAKLILNELEKMEETIEEALNSGD